MSAPRNPRTANGSRRRKALARLRAMRRECWICGLPIDYGAPAGDPLAFECDEVTPVSKGGSPYDMGNLRAAHRCCNGWRSNKPAALVEAVRVSALESFGRWTTPLEFVARARRVERASKARIAPGQPRTTTEW